MRKCLLSNIDSLFKTIASSMELYLPQDTENGAEYKKYEDGAKWSEALSTVRSPKDFFFPQTENLMEFKLKGKSIEIFDIRDEKEDFVIFGVRACDVRSFDILDRVFLTDPVDTFYASKREHGIIVSLACTRPSETCFCKTFDIDPAKPQGDVSSWKDENYLYLEANTDKGLCFLEKLESVTEECDNEAVKAQIEKINKIMDKLPLCDLKAEGFGTGKTEELFNRDEWAELSETCLGCGTCTFVCPTCQCYDIKEFTAGDKVIRFRCWDSCMYSEFTKMAHGNNRNTQVERFRQRFMHKLVYYPENNEGIISCVGCGRCLSRCPISMNIVKVMKTLGGEK